VASNGVQTAREEGAPDQVAKSAPASILDQEDIEDDLHRDIEEVQRSQWHVVDKHGPQSVKEDLAGAEECFSSD